MSLKRCCGLCVYMSLYAYVYLSQNITWRSTTNQKYVRYHPPQIAQFLVPQFSTMSCPWKISECVCVCVCMACVSAWNSLCLCVSKWSAQGSMRKANSLSECRLLRVRRSGRRRRSLGKRAVSSGRRRVISDRRARIRPSCSCSTARMSEMPERSEEHNGCQCEWLMNTVTTLLMH